MNNGSPTLRSVLTGMLIGGVLSLCNIYTGLKVGWGLGMSITAALAGFGLWKLIGLSGRTREFGIHEANLNQTTASSAAAISSAGFVAPIPALTMLTGRVMSWGELVVWTFSVCLVGIVVGAGLRRQLIEVERLAFPSGTATAETLREMYAKGRDAMARVWMLVGGGIVAGVLKILEHAFHWQRVALPGKPGNLGFGFEPTALMLAVGMLIGPRIGLSLMLGSVIAWGVLAPIVFSNGWVSKGPEDGLWYGAGLPWLLWPGVAMMVCAALTSFAFSLGAISRAFRSGLTDNRRSRRWYVIALAAVLGFSAALQVWMFGIAWWIAVLGVLLTFLLATVATRVSGETDITPVGAMGKVTQLMFAVLSPGAPAANLMSANATGGAASQAADLMHDFKSGHILGTKPGAQVIAQVCGAFSGALCGSAGYLLLVPDPAKQLLTEEWPAPAVAAWKAVAEVFMRGLDGLPPHVGLAMGLGAITGICLTLVERLAPSRVKPWLPSAASLGLAFVIPAYNSMSMCVGALLALALRHRAPSWSAAFLIVLASGIIAGESLVGVALALWSMIAA